MGFGQEKETGERLFYEVFAMTMQKDDFEQIIKEDLYSEAEAIQKEIDAAGIEDVPSAFKKSMRLKLQNRIDEYEKEKICAGLSEKDREALLLGRKLLEERSASKKSGRKKRWKIYAASAAAVLLVLTVGITSIGGTERVASVMELIIGDRKTVRVDSDKGNKILEDDEEQEAYQKIKDTFEIEPVKLIRLEKGMKFLRMELDENLQVAEMLYQYNNRNYWYIISAGYYKSSFGHDVEDKIIDEDEIEVSGNKIELITYQLKESEETRCSAYFTYRDLKYFLTGDAKKEDFELILKNLYFL
jgi:hypothetical protein